MGRFVVLNSETGEIVQDLGNNADDTQFVALHEGQVVYSKSRHPHYNYTKLNYDYLKFNFKCAIELYHKCPQLLVLLPFVGYEDNILKFANGRVATMKGLARKLGFSPDYFKGNLLKKLKDLEIVKVTMYEGRRVIVVNPYIVHRGKHTLIDIKEMFENSRWAVYGNGGYDLNDYKEEKD